MSKIDPKEIGVRVRELRNTKRMKQRELAAALGVTLNYVGHIECGIKAPSLDVLIDMAEVFGESLDYLILGKR